MRGVGPRETRPFKQAGCAKANFWSSNSTVEQDVYAAYELERAWCQLKFSERFKIKGIVLPVVIKEWC